MEAGAERVWRSRLAEEREQAVGLLFRLVQDRNPPSSHRLLHLSDPRLGYRQLLRDAISLAEHFA